MDDTHEDGPGRGLLLEGSCAGLEDETTSHREVPSAVSPSLESRERAEVPSGTLGRPARSTRREKREQVLAMLLDPESAAWSDRAIAQGCGVTHRTVGTLRKQLLSQGLLPEASGPRSAERASPPRRRGLDGRIIDVSGLMARARGPVQPRHGEAPPAQALPVQAEEPCRAPPAQALPPRERAEPDLLPSPSPPPWVALACVRWLWETLQLPEAPEVVVPAVGEGAWVDAVQRHRPLAVISRFDRDLSARGIQGSRRTGGPGGTRPGEMHVVADWLAWQPGRLARRSRWDVCVASRPRGSRLERWVEASLSRAEVVALLEPESALGGGAARSWWRQYRPSWVARVVSGPPSGEPPAARAEGWAAPVLVVWQRGGASQTCYDWIDEVGPAADTHARAQTEQAPKSPCA